MVSPITTDTDQFSPFDGSDYRKLKTPFSQITIMSSDKKNKTDLPEQLARLISKIEIHEVYAGECFHPITITITFAEGSREPFPLDTNNESNVNSLYSLGSDNKGNLTNLIGMLTDLRFQGDGSSITAEVSSIAAQTEQQTQGFDEAAATSLSDDVSIVNAPTNQNSNNYLFKQNNILKVTWGYLNGDGGQSKRTVAGIMTVIQADFPESDHPSLTITCQPLTSVFDQITPLKAVKFSSNSSLNVVVPKTFTDIPIPEVIQKVANMCGITKVIISKEVLAPLLDKQHVKVWYGGQSLHEFLSDMARRSLSFYTVILDSDDEYVLVFMSRADVEKQIKLNALGTNLFAYKQPGSLLKSISIKADFATITTTTFAGLNIEGKNTYYSSYHGGKGQVTYTDANQKHDFAPTNNVSDNDPVSVKLAEELPGGLTSGNVVVKPFSNSSIAMSEGSSAHAGCTNKIVSLEFSSIGFHLIKAGEPILITGIGERFSTVYRVQEVSHILDSDGYNCHGTLLSALFSGNGNSATKTAQGVIPEQVTDQMFNPLASSAPTGTDTKDQYDSTVIGQ